MPIYNDQRAITVEQAKTNSKIINAELPKTNPAGIIDFFEIDLEDILFDNLLLATKIFNTPASSADSERVFRFHNCLNFTTKTILFQGKAYYAAPINIEDIEYTTKGSMPRPKLSITANAKSSQAMALLKAKILELGDLTKAKLIRRRTFTKFIDKENSKELLSQILNHEENPKAILRLDIFYFFRNTYITETYLEFELASTLDIDNTGLPNRIVLQDKCVWQYRGEGCCYDTNLKKNIHGFTSPGPPSAAIYPNAQPVADANNLRFEKIPEATESYLPDKVKLSNKGLWTKNANYLVGQYIFIVKNDIRYYFVCKVEHTNVAPPNSSYWGADQCDKSIRGCKLRFNQKKGLPFGGFAAVRKSASV